MLAGLAAAPGALGATFSADPSSLGPIPDGGNGAGNFGAPLNVTFTADGLPGDTSLSDVGISLRMNPGHTWVGDLDVVLLGPGGAPSKTIFSRVGATSGSSVGSGANLITNATYAFSDTAPASPTFWQVAPNDSTANVTAGTYRATTPGGSASGGQNTLITPAFAGTADPNGTWTLRFRDGGVGDLGSVSQATLSLSLVQRTVSVAKAGSGTGTITSSGAAAIDCGATCSAQFDDGRSTALVAHPGPGSVFAGWSGGGCSGTGACQLPEHADSSVTATFTRPTLTVNKTGSGTGTVSSSPAGIDCGGSCSSVVDDGTPVTLTATPDAGSAFSGWSGGGCAGTGSCRTTLDSDKAVTATFTARRTLAVTEHGTGKGTVTSDLGGIACGASCSAIFDIGAPVTLTAVPSSGSAFDGWSGAGCSGDGACAVTMDSDRQVVATFTAKPPPDLRITDVRIDQAERSAAFTFTPAGKRAFLAKCALAKRGQDLHFRLCSSPARYTGLKPGKYTFAVRAVNRNGIQAKPAEKAFRIKR